MKKLILGAAVSAALLGGYAQAQLPTGYTAANTYIMHTAGASASRPFIEKTFTTSSAGVCAVTAANPFYMWQDSSSNNQNAYACTLSAAASAQFGGKTKLLMYKRSSGGSAVGITSLTSGTTFMNVENVGTCIPTAGNTVTCADVSGTIVPEFGTSDVDPQVFAGLGVVTPAQASGVLSQGAFAQIFGIPVTLGLYQALQTAQFAATNVCNPNNAGYNTLVTGLTYGSKAKIKQGETKTCMPTLSTAQVTSILTGQIRNWSQVYVETAAGSGAPGVKLTTAAGVAAPASDAVHVCSRTVTSGTLAAATVKFLNSKPLLLSDGGFPAEGPIPTGNTTNQVHQLSSGGVVSECLDELDKGVNTTGTSFNNPYNSPRWAIGIQSTDNNANQAFNYRFVKIDGFAPTAQNVSTNAYKYWVDSVYTTLPTLAGTDLTAVNFIIKQTSTPSVIGAINNTSGSGCPGYTGIATQCFGPAGFLAAPNVGTNAALVGGNITAGSASPVNPLSHDVASSTGSNPDNTRIPMLYQPLSPTYTKGLENQ